MASPIVSQDLSSNGFLAVLRRVSHGWLGTVRARLLALVAFALVPALLLILYVAIEQRRQGIEAAKSDALSIVGSVSRLQEEIIESTRQLLAALAQAPCVQSNDPAACGALLRELSAQRPLYANIAVADPNGAVFASAHGGNTSLADRSYFQIATNTGGLAVGDYEVSELTKKTTVNFAYPAIDSKGSVRAIVLAALDFAWLYRHVTNAMLPARSSMTVLGRDGMTLARYPDDRFVGDRIKVPPQPANWRWPDRPQSKISRSRDGTMRLYVATRLGRESVVGVNVGIPVESVFGPANRMLARNLFFLAIATALSGMAAWYGGDFFIVRRIRSLLGVTRRLSSGDLAARTNEEDDRGELSELARAFDGMAASLQQRVAERDSAEASLRDLNANLEQRVADRTAALRRSNEELEQFAVVVSQDLREPLQTISQYLRSLESQYLQKFDENGRDFIAYSRDGAERMQALILGLLDYSRLGTRAKLFGPVSTELSLRDALSNLALNIEETGARISQGAMPTVQGDPVQVLLVFQNLIANALRFRSEAAPVIRVWAERDGDFWRFAVRDNGIGIRQADFERIFVVFQRLHTRKKYPGTGIGLAACKKIVERHGGRIWVESTPGQGSTFYFTLLAVAEAEASAPSALPSEAAIAAN
jgi:signal transduction histidine kinase